MAANWRHRSINDSRDTSILLCSLLQRRVNSLTDIIENKASLEKTSKQTITAIYGLHAKIYLCTLVLHDIPDSTKNVSLYPAVKTVRLLILLAQIHNVHAKFFVLSYLLL